MNETPPRLNILSSAPGPDESAWDVPPPVLFNPWKHHAGALRRRIAAVARGGESALAELPAQLLVIGTELMDLYTGALTPADIAARILAQLAAEGRLAPAAYQAWLAANGGYQVRTFPEDESRWVLRMGEAGGRYVHVHPGRWSPATRRVRANVLKTAVMVLACTSVHGGDPYDVQLVNAVRRQYLGLSPVRAVGRAEGLGLVLAILQGAPAGA
jgi:hypothetical protein